MLLYCVNYVYSDWDCNIEFPVGVYDSLELAEYAIEDAIDRKLLDHKSSLSIQIVSLNEEITKNSLRE